MMMTLNHLPSPWIYTCLLHKRSFDFNWFEMLTWRCFGRCLSVALSLTVLSSSLFNPLYLKELFLFYCSILDMCCSFICFVVSLPVRKIHFLPESLNTRTFCYAQYKWVSERERGVNSSFQFLEKALSVSLPQLTSMLNHVKTRQQLSSMRERKRERERAAPSLYLYLSIGAFNIKFVSKI